MVGSNEVIKNDFNIDKDGIPVEKQIQSPNTIKQSPNNFSNYQNLIDLFINLRDGNINPREVLKDQINFKLDLSWTKKEVQIQNQKIK